MDLREPAVTTTPGRPVCRPTSCWIMPRTVRPSCRCACTLQPIARQPVTDRLYRRSPCDPFRFVPLIAASFPKPVLYPSEASALPKPAPAVTQRQCPPFQLLACAVRGCGPSICPAPSVSFIRLAFRPATSGASRRRSRHRGADVMSGACRSAPPPAAPRRSSCDRYRFLWPLRGNAITVTQEAI